MQMKVDKLFAVLVIGGGMMAGCGGQPQTMPEASDASAEEAPDEAEQAPASAPAAGEAGADGKDGKCAWY